MTVPIGVTVSTTDLASIPTAPAQIDTLFVAGVFDAGAVGPVLHTSYSDLVAVRGARTSLSGTYHDYIRAAFDAGAARVYTVRTLGPGATVSGSGPTQTTSDDDHANIVTAGWTAAFAKFTKDYGPGTLLLPGGESATLIGVLDAAAGANDRLYKADVPDASDQAAVLTLAGTLRALTYSDRGDIQYGHGTVTQDGIARTVGLSALKAGMEALNDANGEYPNQPASGDLGIPRIGVTLTRTQPTDTDWTALTTAGVNIWRTVLGSTQPRSYGNRTTADPAVKPLGKYYASARLRMLLTWRASGVGEHYVQKLLDKNGVELKHLEADLLALLAPFAAGLKPAVGAYAAHASATGTAVTASLTYQDEFASETVNIPITRALEV